VSRPPSLFSPNFVTGVPVTTLSESEDYRQHTEDHVIVILCRYCYQKFAAKDAKTLETIEHVHNCLGKQEAKDEST
jgi:hypothetical protein